MTVSEMQAKLKARVWQGVAQSGVDLSALAQADLDKLVGAITAGVLVEVDEVLGQVSANADPAPAATDDDDEAEEILWEGRPFLSISIRYQITSERIRVVQGLLSKERFDIELVRIQDVDHKQTLTERTLNIGDVYIRSHDPSYPKITLDNVTDPMEVHEILRRAILKARKKYNLSYREEM
jgi:hypothetical protein